MLGENLFNPKSMIFSKFRKIGYVTLKDLGQSKFLEGNFHELVQNVFFVKLRKINLIFFGTHNRRRHLRQAPSAAYDGVRRRSTAFVTALGGYGRRRLWGGPIY